MKNKLVVTVSQVSLSLECIDKEERTVHAIEHK